jgi:hypothetical protein
MSTPLTDRHGVKSVKCFNENQWTPETTVEETECSEKQGNPSSKKFNVHND